MSVYNLLNSGIGVTFVASIGAIAANKTLKNYDGSDCAIFQ